MAARDALEELLSRKASLDERIAGAPALGLKLHELRAWQAQRLARSYEDLKREPRYAAAVDFFLTDLYGPHGAAARDAQLRRAWRYFKRALPRAAREVLERAITLDVLSAELDLHLAGQLQEAPLTADSYAAAYRRADRAPDRRLQIDLLIGIGRDLDRLVRHGWIGVALRAAHLPAHTSGFGALQDFMERGFEAFGRMRGADRFLKTIADREGQLMQALFEGARSPAASSERRARP